MCRQIRRGNFNQTYKIVYLEEKRVNNENHINKEILKGNG